MKVLTKYLKVALCFMAFALCSFMFAFTPTFTAVQAAELTNISYNMAINALKMPTEEVDYDSEDETKKVFRIPYLDSSVLGSATASYKIRVIDPAGYSHDYDPSTGEAVKSEDEHYFVDESTSVKINAKNDGEYKVIYIVTDGEGDAKRTYYSNSYTVTVANVSYELDFSTPVLDDDYAVVGTTKNIIKTKLATSETPYELPVAYVKVLGDNLSIRDTDGAVTNAVASIKVTKDGAPQDVETSNFFKEEDGKYYIVPKEEGVYTVEYTAENTINRPTKTFTINVEDGYTASALKLASTPTMPKMELGKTITLPKLTVNAGSETNVDVNVTSIRIEKETDSTIYCELTNNNFKFTMSPENFNGVDNYEDMVGNYRITYKVQGAYTTQTLTETFKVDGVTVSTDPIIKLAYNHNAAENYDEDSKIFGAEVELKAEYEYAAGFVLPAVYVEDAVTTDYSDFKIVRAIRKGSTYYYIDNVKYDEATGELSSEGIDEKYLNASGDANIGHPEKAVTFKFNEKAENIEGTYYLEYWVITDAVKERDSDLYVTGTNDKYSFKLVSSHTKTTPTVEITNLKDSSVKNTETISVKVSSTDSLDTRLKNAVFTYSEANKTGYATNFQADLEDVIENLLIAIGPTNKECNILEDERLWAENWSIEGVDSEGNPKTYTGHGLKYYYSDIAPISESSTKNTFNVSLAGKSGSVNVLAVAINDDGMVDIDEKTLTIKNTNDPDAPVINIYASKFEEDSLWLDDENHIQEFQVGQGETITLPSVYVVDADKTLSLNVMYYINSPENSYGGIKYLSPANKSFYYDTTIVEGQEYQVINGGTITTSEKGIYYVAYTATDVAGNTSVMYFTFEVVDTSKPILSVETVSDDEITISGNTVTAGKGTVIDFEATLRSSDGTQDFTNGNVSVTVEDEGKGLDYQPSGDSRTSYVFNDYGTYVITISGSYTTTVNNEKVELKADNKVIKVVIEKQEIKWLGEFDVPEYASKNDDVILPDVKASNNAVVKVTYVTPGSAESEALEATKVTSETGYTYWTFKTNDTSKGTYTVIYTATTDEDVLTKKITIKVGDNVAPTLTFTKGELTQDLVFDGTNDIEYVLEVNKKNKTFVVTAINNGEEVYSYNIGLKISDKDDTGSTTSNMSWTNLSYELTGAKVTKGDVTTTDNTEKTQYSISGVGKYTLKLTMKDSYDNERVETIEFNVVTKSEAKENKDTVVGTVLIVISLVLLAGVILFFTFTGNKGGKGKAKSAKSKTNKTVKSTKVEEAKVEFVEETAKEAEVEEKVDDEPKTGDVE